MTNLLLQLEQPPRPPVHRAMVRAKVAQPTLPRRGGAGGEIILRRRWQHIVFIGALPLPVVMLRQPGDLDAFSAMIIEEIAEGRHTQCRAA